MIKQAFIKAAVFSMSVGLIVSCSPANTQNQNTVIGATTGAVIGGVAGSAIGAGTGQVVAIGAGAVAGALIGGAIGNSWDHSDYVQTVYVMEHTTHHHSHHWRNKKSGAEYVVTPMSKSMKMKGYSNCRKFTMTAVLNGKKQKVHGVACRQADGSWKTVK